MDNYRTINNFNIRLAKVPTPKAEVYWQGIWQKNKCYLIYRRKEIIAECTGKFEGDDWIVFHIPTGKRFRMKNYPENQDNTFRVAQIDESAVTSPR